MSTARKPVIARKLTREWYAGYLSGAPIAESAELELLDPSGKLLRMSWEEIRWVCYIRDAGILDAGGRGSLSADPERLLRRRFSSRPRLPGLWLRMTLADGEELEGVAANDHSLIAGTGLMLIPPDTRSNTQRVFVPRSSIRELTVLGVVAPSASARQKGVSQPGLFAAGQIPEQSSGEQD